MRSVLIVDDHVVVRCGLKQILNEEYRGLQFGEAETASEAVSLVSRRRWDLVILALPLGTIDGMRTLAEIRVAQPETRILVFSSSRDPRQAERAMKLGAVAYVAKQVSRPQLLRSVNNALAGVRTGRKEKAGTEKQKRALSEREFVVARELASGKRPMEIASALEISTKTIHTYKRRLLHKLQLKTMADLVRYADYHF